MRKKKWTAAEKAVREEAAERLAHLMLETISEKKLAKRKARKGASTKHKLSEDTIKAAIGYGESLRKVHARLVAEGKVKVVNGKVIFVEEPNT